MQSSHSPTLVLAVVLGEDHISDIHSGPYICVACFLSVYLSPPLSKSACPSPAVTPAALLSLLLPSFLISVLRLTSAAAEKDDISPQSTSHPETETAELGAAVGLSEKKECIAVYYSTNSTLAMGKQRRKTE